MRNRFGHPLAFVLILTGISAASPAASEPPTAGTISVEPGGVEQTLRASTPVFVDEVGKILAEKGFTVIEGTGHARFVASLTITRAEVGTGTAKVAAARTSISPGGNPIGAGGGIRVPLPSGKSKTVPLEQTRLEIRIRRLREEAVLWHAAAVTVRAADTREGNDAAVSSALSEAILRGYPVQSEDVISVP